MLEIIDRHSFNFKVFFVAASGFLASSYALFAPNVIRTALYYVYPPCGRLSSNAGAVIDQLTLIGTALGMLFGGHFADLWGRKRLYGVELGILIVATFGVIMSSEGFIISKDDGTYRYTMSIYSWIAAWRFILGVGIGAGVSNA
jgi:PHS family inorganic phosphate transporter-like MFS transporter